MNITTKYRNVNGTPKVTATLNGKQKTLAWDLSKSTDWNHGTAAGAVILHVSSTMHPLTQQNGDHLGTSVVRSLDNGYGEHTASDDGTVHRFNV